MSGCEQQQKSTCSTIPVKHQASHNYLSPRPAVCLLLLWHHRDCIWKNSRVHFSVISLLLTLSSDIELNPGPVRFPCGRCGRAVQSNLRGICFDQCDRWFHIGCANVSCDEYTRLSNSSDNWVCTCTLCLIPPTTQAQQHRQVETIEHVQLNCGRVVQSNSRRIICHQCNQWFHAT